MANLKEAIELYFADGAPVPSTIEQPLAPQIESAPRHDRFAASVAALDRTGFDGRSQPPSV
ncbi:MAG: hypothetical protein ACYCTZ_12105 [Candidatus Dormibacteria bacterium]